MNLTGKISDSKETLPGANIFVSDSKGKIIVPTNGSSTDIAGKYTLYGLKPEDYITVSFIGYKPITKKVSSLGSGIRVNYNFTLQPGSASLEEFEVIAYKDDPKETVVPISIDPNIMLRKKKNYKPFIYVCIGILAILTGVIVYKKMKK